LLSGTVQAHAFNRSGLVTDAAQRPGLRVLEGRFGVSEFALAVPKGPPVALAFVTEIVEQANASGLTQQAVERAGLVGVQVPLVGAPANSRKAATRMTYHVDDTGI